MARFELMQRLAIRDEIALLIDRSRATRTPIKLPAAANSLFQWFPDGGLSRDQIALTIIDVARAADVVLELEST